MGEIRPDGQQYVFTNRRVDIGSMEDPDEVRAYIEFLEQAEDSGDADVDREQLITEARERLVQLSGE